MQTEIRENTSMRESWSVIHPVWLKYSNALRLRDHDLL